MLDAVMGVTAEIPIPENRTEPVVLPLDSFAVSVQEVNVEEFDMEVFSVSLGSNFFSGDLELNENNLNFSSVPSSTASLTLPESLFDSRPASNSSRITRSVFLTDALYLRRNDSTLEVGSVIIAASVVNSSVQGLEPPIILTFLKNTVSECSYLQNLPCRLVGMILKYQAYFSLLQSIENGTNPLCTFWNPQLDGKKGIFEMIQLSN